MPFEIQRFKKSMNAVPISESAKTKLLRTCNAYSALTTPHRKAQWIRDMVIRLSSEIGEKKARQVMQGCGSQCIGPSVLERARRLKQRSTGLDDLINRLNRAHIGGGKLQRKENEIHAAYERCYCGSISRSRQKIPITYCYCSCGWYQRLFETLLEKPVRVQLINSIADGAADCRFIIHISKDSEPLLRRGQSSKGFIIGG